MGVITLHGGRLTSHDYNSFWHSIKSNKKQGRASEIYRRRWRRPSNPVGATRLETCCPLPRWLRVSKKDSNLDLYLFFLLGVKK